MLKVWAQEYNAPLKYSGKERDDLLGLDYFGTRYYAFGLYRFNSTDPVVDVGGAIENPQLWNRYSYCRNNPLTVVDLDGKWSETNHDLSIRKEFAKTDLKPWQVEIIVSSNNEFDLSSQDKPYVHGMREPGQSILELERWLEDFRNRKIQEIQESRADRALRGDKRIWTRRELRLFGELQHPFVDMNCPSHNGIFWLGYSWDHISGDLKMSKSQLKSNTQVIRALFKEASK